MCGAGIRPDSFQFPCVGETPISARQRAQSRMRGKQGGIAREEPVFQVERSLRKEGFSALDTGGRFV